MRIHLIITGRVQGVFFRSKTKKQAKKLNLTGFVRNNPNGTVEIVAEGSKDNIDKLISWCKKGPLLSKVTDIKIKREKPTGKFTDFSIVY